MRPALDDEELDLLQRWCGLALIGENVAQKFPILTGTAGGGKGTFIRVLTGIIGQANSASLRPQLLGERFELGRFLGKTLLYGADVPENFLNQRAASVLKSLTGGDPMTLEFKNSNETPSIICQYNVILTSNSRLTVHLEGDTDAWNRRLVSIDYCQPKPKEVISDLSERILAGEGSGVLNWQLAGLDKIRADGWQLRLSSQQQARVDNLLLQSDGHSVFARECLMRDGNGQLTVPDGFAAYVEFCTQRGWNALTKNKFGALIGDVVVRQFGLTVRHDIPDDTGKPQRGWRGIAVISTRSACKKVSEMSELLASDIPDGFSTVPKLNLVEELV
jgi:P4 family phage/plasmid primase-like protien